MLDLILPTLLLLLPFAVWTGYRVGRNSPKKKLSNKPLSPGYFSGLNYLLNEEPDKAIDAFIALLQVDSETVETHLALGNLFRRRGEVDRAIRIHQNLIARPSLSGETRKLALLELAYDYMAAGLFDRAENLFLELVKEHAHRKDSLKNLTTIYQRTKDWQKAIDTNRKIAQLTGKNQNTVIAHYYCEMAESAREGGNLKLAHEQVSRALSTNKNSVRASILQGQLFQQIGQNKDAIKSYQRIRHQDIDFLSEVLPELINCYRLDGKNNDLLKYLTECLQQGAGISVLVAISELLQEKSDDKKAVSIIIDYLNEHPSLKGLEQLIQLKLLLTSNDRRDDLQLLHGLVVKLIDNNPVYRCDSCGYSGKTLFWQCPSCKEWETIRPIHGTDGE